MGFLADQTGDYVCHYASIHASAIRHLLFTHAFLKSGEGGFSQVRKRISTKLEILSYAGLIWELFKNLIYGVLDRLSEKIGSRLSDEIKKAIGLSMAEFFEKALQIDEATFYAERRAKQLAV